MIRLVAGAWVCLIGAAAAQQRPADAPPVVEAKKEVIVNWTLGNQVWDFKAILATYEPVKGVFDPLLNQATWTFQIVKDMEPGAAALHNQTQGTPFKPVLLTAEKAVMALDAKVQMSAVTGKMGDTIQIDVKLPEKETLDAVKLIRVERRTNVGF